jgi:hypothetical protein
MRANVQNFKGSLDRPARLTFPLAAVDGLLKAGCRRQIDYGCYSHPALGAFNRPLANSNFPVAADCIVHFQNPH